MKRIAIITAALLSLIILVTAFVFKLNNSGYAKELMMAGFVSIGILSGVGTYVAYYFLNAKLQPVKKQG